MCNCTPGNLEIPGWGRAHAQSVRRLWGHGLHIGAIGERLPNRDSRVDLDPEARDRFAVPLARIASVLSEADIVRLRFMHEVARIARGQRRGTDL